MVLGVCLIAELLFWLGCLLLLVGLLLAGWKLLGVVMDEVKRRRAIRAFDEMEKVHVTLGRMSGDWLVIDDGRYTSLPNHRLAMEVANEREELRRRTRRKLVEASWTWDWGWF